MFDWFLAYATTVVVAFVPGVTLLVLFVPPARRRPVLLFAAGPPLSISWLFAVSEVLDLFGIHTTPAAQVLAFAAAVALLLFIDRARAGDRQTQTTSSDTRVGGSSERVAVALLFVAMAIGMTVWTIALREQPHNPPSRDGEYHGYFVKRIADTGSIDPQTVLTTDPVTNEPAASFYPLALHNAVALQYRVVGLGIGLLLTSWVVICSSVVLPAGLFVLVRRLLPDRPLVAGYTSFIIPFFAMFPYRPATWSAISLIVGMAFVPATIALVGLAGDAVRDRHRWIVAAAYAVFGVVSSHTSQLGLLALWLALLTMSDGWRTRSNPAAIRRRAENLLAVGGCALVLYLPALLMLREAGAERNAFAEHAEMTMAQALGSMVTLSYAMPAGQSLLAVLVLTGIWLAARDRVLGAWLACLIGVTLLFLATAAIGGPTEVVRPLTRLWYYGSWRMSYNVALAMTVFAGYALASAADGATRALRYVRLRHAPLVGAAVVAVALMGVGLTTLDQPIDIVRTAYATNSPASRGQLDAFRYLRSNVPAGRPVLNEERDGSTWMYAEYGLLPLMGVYSYQSSEQTDDRIYLATHIADYATDERVRTLIERWNIDYLLVNETGFIDEPPRVKPADLAGKIAFTEVFTSEGSHVYRINRDA